MKNNIFNTLIVSVLAATFFVSCSKTDTTPQTCYVTSMTNPKGVALEKFTYDTNDRLLTDVNDSLGITFNFSYNTQNLIDKITTTDKVGSKIYTYITTFTYDATGKAISAVTSFNGTNYQTNTFTYSATNQLTSITTTDFQKEVDIVRFEYTSENITKVYQKFDGDKEYLYAELTKFDTMKNIYPAAYQSLAIGLTGLIDGFYFLNKNNVLSEKNYEEDGILIYTRENTFEYNTTSQPTKIASVIVDSGKKSATVDTFQYNCK